ncbi:MAG: hypothetical protein C4584_00715 [Armatimonadetes bacterium]|nr:MAG: hypothetical protein C4584_00715 [Armatimonadota bacterium]
MGLLSHFFKKDTKHSKNPGVKKTLFKVNLLIIKGEQIKLHLKLLKWILSSGRYIIIIVELIVISAFVARYKLDSDLLNIQEQISEQVPFIKSLENDELLIRQTQFQLNTIRQIKNEAPDFARILSTIAKLTPRNTQLINIGINRTENIGKTNLSISGRTVSNLELSAFINALEEEPIFTEVTLTNISFEGQTVFTITAALSPGQGRKS